ncbi:MAG: methyl-accepting chemotaxis protein [Azoarcus sp.]|jgi:methyl-accepting chemotaxis protein|nr:methyl-accepting chemotaxis protein [Azoarcus sp.]
MKPGMRITRKIHIRSDAALVGIVAALCIGLACLSVSTLMQTMEYDEYAFCVTVSVVTFILLVLGLIGFLIKVTSRKPIEKVHFLLKRFKEEGGFINYSNGEITDSNGEITEVATALDEMMDELYGLFQSIQGKVQTVDRNMEVLATEIHQAATEQTNLFSLIAAVEAVRSQQDGYSVISSEILSLVERTGHLTGGVRDIVRQLRTGTNEIIAELEHVLSRIDPDRTGAQVNEGTCAIQERTDTPVL